MPLGRAGSIPAQRTEKPPFGGFFIWVEISRSWENMIISHVQLN